MLTIDHSKSGIYYVLYVLIFVGILCSICIDLCSKTVCVNLFSKDGKVKMKSAQHWDLEPKSFRAASLKIPGRLEFAALKIEHFEYI